MLRDRDDVDRLRALRHRALRDGGVPLLAAPGRPAHRLGPGRPQDGGAAAADLRPDARAEMGDRDGRLCELGRDVQQLHDPPGRRPDRAGRHLRAVLPAAAGSVDGRDHPAARGPPGGSAAGVRAARGRHMSYDALPGFVDEREAFGERTVTIEAARVRDACEYARDELGFAMLCDVVATDYLE